MGLKEKLLKNSTIAETALLEQSKLWEPKDTIVTDVLGLNIALSGSLTGGMVPGLIQIAAESARFKSKFAIEIIRAFQKKFTKGATLFYDSEFGTPRSYFNEMNLDEIIHSPVINLEALIHDISIQFDDIDPVNDRLLVVLDSLGNIPSLKESTDILKVIKKDKDGNIIKGVPQDMTRQKEIRKLFRIIGPQLHIKNIYMVVVNHTYKNIMDMYGSDVVSGGGGPTYNSNAIWTIGRPSRVKDDGKELTGFDFTINIHKSRFVKQDKKIPISVSFDEGINKYSGIFDLAIESGHIIRPTKQTYALADKPDATFPRKEIENSEELYNYLLNDTDFPL